LPKFGGPRCTRVRGLPSPQPRAQNGGERETRINNKNESPVQTTTTHNAMIRNRWKRAIQWCVCVCVCLLFSSWGRGGPVFGGDLKGVGTSIKGVRVWVYGDRWLVLQEAQHPRPPPRTYFHPTSQFLPTLQERLGPAAVSAACGGGSDAFARSGAEGRGSSSIRVIVAHLQFVQ